MDNIDEVIAELEKILSPAGEIIGKLTEQDNKEKTRIILRNYAKNVQNEYRNTLADGLAKYFAEAIKDTIKPSIVKALKSFEPIDTSVFIASIGRALANTIESTPMTPPPSKK